MNFRFLIPTLLLTLLTLVLTSSIIYAHGGRTDSSGCHTNHSTGSYHCHGAPDNPNNYDSSYPVDDKSYDYSSNIDQHEFRDSDQNGINDLDQDWDELAENIKLLGDNEGYFAAKNNGEYNPIKFFNTYSNAEYSWFKLGYEEGFNRGKLEVLEGNAEEDGEKAGFTSDSKTIPNQYQNSAQLKRAFEEGFVTGQMKRWNKVARETAAFPNPLLLPEGLPKSVKESAQRVYNNRIDVKKKDAFEEGYAFAFQNKELRIPVKYNNVPVIAAEFENGFHSNTDILDYKQQAYESGKLGEDILMPLEVSENKAEAIYQEYFEKGKKKFAEEQKRNKMITRIALIALLVIIFVMIYFFTRKYKNRHLNSNKALQME
jgi:hypothetical protein